MNVPQQASKNFNFPFYCTRERLANHQVINKWEQKIVNGLFLSGLINQRKMEPAQSNAVISYVR